jgi:hypothetical protein
MQDVRLCIPAEESGLWVLNLMPDATLTLVPEPGLENREEERGCRRLTLNTAAQ